MSCYLNIETISITGDCSNTSSGAFELQFTGSAPSYLIYWVSPSGGTAVALGSSTSYSLDSLSAGTYQFELIDSCAPFNTILPISIYISSGTCVSITDIENTTCNQVNGSITATTTNYYDVNEFYLYELNNGLITSGSVLDYSIVFNNLSAGTYYVVADDGGGCTGKTESCIIKSSSTLNFGFYTINNAACAFNSGAIYITGLTGTAPYTYSWSPNGETTSFITGLTDGFYSVNVTDSSGCVQSLGTNIISAQDFGIGTFTAVNPSCFASDGEITVIVTGGTAPYYYSGSNGEVQITFSTSYTFTGLAAGAFSVLVTDAGLCSVSSSTFLNTPNSFSTILVSTTNSTCNNNSGAINFNFLGGSGPYIYTLVDSSGNTQTITDTTPGTIKSYGFNNLSSGTYTLTISDGGPCVFSQSVTILNTTLFTLSTSTTGTTCDNNNGSVTLSITSGGTAPYKFEIDTSIIFGVTGTSFTFTNLPSGNYTASVTDVNLCQQSVGFVIDPSNTIDFYLSATNVENGNDGEITAFITTGEPPFTLNWSSNVGGQTGSTITGLTAGTYSLSITDDNGCVRTRSTTLLGFNKVSSFELFTLCENQLSSDGTLIRRGPEQMLIEGFHDLTSGDTNCIINTASFYLEANLNGNIKGLGVYISSGITDFPSDDYFYQTLQTVLESYDEIDSVIVNAAGNTISISTICNPEIYIIDANLMVNLIINYDISCEECGSPVVAPFIFTIDTTKLSLGSTGTDKFQLPTISGGIYDFQVDWGDGVVQNINSWNDPNTEHTYTSVGTYEISISGQFSGWTFNNGGDRAKILEIKQWGILELGNSVGHFYGCVNLELSGTTDFIDLSTTNTLQQTFRNCTSITTINNAEYWDISTITDMTETFRNATSFNHPIGSWDVSNVTSTFRMFQTAFAFNQDISGWDVSNVTNTSQMFTSATVFNQPLNDWNVSNVTNMGSMFASATSFNQPLSGWNVSNVTNMGSMFSNTTTFNQDINGWDVSNVTNMSNMFATASSFNQPLSGWNVSNVTTMFAMFQASTSFNQPLNSWDVSNVTTMFGMFQNASSFDQPLDFWNVSNVTTMTGMFNNTIAFNQDVSTWDVSNVTDMTSMLDNCGMNQSKYEALLVGWNSLPSLQPNVQFGANGRQYQIGSAADTARSNIIGTYSWIISGDIAVP